MQKFITRYALAAHLALVAVAPLLLLPFFAPDAVAVVLIWLAALAAFWLVLQPSCLHGETVGQARSRVRGAVLRDLVFWTGVVVGVYFCLLLLRDGVDMAYDPAHGGWHLRRPVGAGFFGAVKGAGALPLATAVGLVVTVQGVSHALGRRARRAFLLTGSCLSAVGVFVMMGAVKWGNLASLVECDYSAPFFFGVACGWWAIAGVVALYQTARECWRNGLFAAAFASCVNAAGLCLFAPAAEIICFEMALLLLSLIAFGVYFRRLSLQYRVMSAAAAVLILATPYLVLGLGRGQNVLADRFAALVRFGFWSDSVAALRECLAGLSHRLWQTARPYGIGLGAFPTCLRVFATPSDWAVIRPWQSAAPNGWWQLLLEQGWIGVAWFGVYAVWPLAVWGRRIFGRRGDFHWGVTQILMPVALLLGVVTMGLSASGTRADVLLVFFPLLALSEGAIPRSRRTMGEERSAHGR